MVVATITGHPRDARSTLTSSMWGKYSGLQVQQFVVLLSHETQQKNPCKVQITKAAVLLSLRSRDSGETPSAAAQTQALYAECLKSAQSQEAYTAGYARKGLAGNDRNISLF